MQYDPKDLQIFVTGVVGRAMGSGKFDAAAIGTLTQAAVETFLSDIAPRLAQAPRPAPAASQGYQAVRPMAGPQNAPTGNPDVPMETKSFSMWGGDKCYLFDYKDALWTDLVTAAQNGDVTVKAALEKAAKAGLGKDPKWHSANAKRIGRAKACLKIIADGQRVSAPMPPTPHLTEADWSAADSEPPF